MKVILSAGLAVCVAIKSGAFEGRCGGSVYQVANLGSIQGTVNPAPYAINNNGQVTGYSQRFTGNHGFLYSAGTMTDIGNLGASGTDAFAINSSGQVTGYSHLPSSSDPDAFLYSGGVMIDIGTLPV